MGLQAFLQALLLDMMVPPNTASLTSRASAALLSDLSDIDLFPMRDENVVAMSKKYSWRIHLAETLS